jgi:beta-phosphoglucomutase
MKNHNRAIIWDMDGVLVDSWDVHYITWRDTLAAEFGLHIDMNTLRDFFGIDNGQVLREVTGLDLPDEEIARIVERKEACYRDLAPGLIRGIPAALALLQQARTVGWRNAVGTSSPRENLRVMRDLLGLDRWMDAYVTIDDVSRGKPSPEMFLEAARRLGVPPQRCVVIEDSPQGIAAARAARMGSVGVMTTQSAERLAQADRVVGSLDEITLDDLAALVSARA